LIEAPDPDGDAAAVIIGTYADSLVTSKLLDLLSSQDSQISIRAINALGRSKQPKLVGKLSNFVLHGEYPQINREIVSAICSIGGYEALLSAIHLLGHEDEIIVRTVTRFLSDEASDHERLIDILWDIIEKDNPSFRMISRIINILSLTATENAIKVLLYLVQEGDNLRDGISRLAEEALITIGDDAIPYIWAEYRVSEDLRLAEILRRLPWSRTQYTLPQSEDEDTEIMDIVAYDGYDYSNQDDEEGGDGDEDDSLLHKYGFEEVEEESELDERSEQYDEDDAEYDDK
jgi:hypothetical protein